VPRVKSVLRVAVPTPLMSETSGLLFVFFLSCLFVCWLVLGLPHDTIQVAITGHAMQAFAAKDDGNSGQDTSAPADALATAAAAASLSLAGSTETFAGMRNGASYISFDKKHGVRGGARVASRHRARAMPKVEVTANTEKLAAAPVCPVLFLLGVRQRRCVAHHDRVMGVLSCVGLFTVDAAGVSC